jgi:YidC/Oxa1 family membrane protein insertase
MHILQGVLWPLSAALKMTLEAIHGVLGSYGLSIICLSLIVSLLISPVAAYARRLERKDRLRTEAMAPQIAEIKQNYTGQQRFERIDKIYQQHGYHPINSMLSVLPLLIQLPFLLAALFMLMNLKPLQGQSFLFIDDLAQPDGLLRLGGYAINVLPLLLIAVTILESHLQKESTPQSRRRFLIVAAVLLVLIYPAPAGVCLYWFTATCFSLARALIA